MDLRSAKLQADVWLQAGAAQTVAEMLNRHAGAAHTPAEASKPAETDRLPAAAMSAPGQG